MLITCPECLREVSDKAESCPNCGFPINKTKRKKAHVRLPNGFGQISKLKDKNLRNPYRAMVTVGKTEFGKPICKILKPKGYFRTYNEAYEALVEYNKNPYELDKMITLEELFTEWFSEFSNGGKSENVICNCKRGWNACENIKRMKVREIRAYHLRDCMNSVEKDYVKRHMKMVLNLLFDYAVEHEATDKNYARMISIGEVVEKKPQTQAHSSFSDADIKEMWSLEGTSIFVDMLLVQCYSGWRPNEVCSLENANIKDGFMTGGSKTEAGKDRIVPIHPAIKHIIDKYYDPEYKYLFHRGNRPMKYRSYYYHCKLLFKDHSPHDGRKHFVTMAKKYKVDEFAIKYIVGHTITDLTENTYTDRDPQWLAEEISKIPCMNGV